MGQIYSFLGYGNTTGNNNQEALLLGEDFSCKICLEVLHDPVQCQNNEHYFCRKCVTKHLGNSERCPLCMDQLTLETLRPAPRIVASVVSQLKKPRCSHVSRGCEENVQVEELLLHEQTCGYAPVVCSNEGCKETVNRRDKESHETEECKFRKITCESCDEELVYVDYYKNHQCSLRLRKEIDEIKLRLDEMNDALKQIVSTGTKHKMKLATNSECVRNNKQTSRQEEVPCKSSTAIRGEKNVVNGQIFIFGGDLFDDEIGKSVEVFNWSTKTWTLIKNCLFFQRWHSFSFLYGKKIMVCGGYSKGRIEYLNPSESGYTATVSSVSLPSNAKCNGLLHKGRLLTFHKKSVVETSLDSPGESRTLLAEKQDRNISAGVHCFGNNIYIVGGIESSMEKYDVVKNEIKTLPSLPYTVSGMATVAYKDNIIILGGLHGEKALDDVVMFNVTNQEYKKLPSLLETRYGCAAVIIGDMIVVMGGMKKDNESDWMDHMMVLKTVEYYVIGDSAWQKLPAMNLGRSYATACVYMY
ncbi:E3 ubiquitin- ligase PDZRN3 [Paramuricea clavata]|uniref:E3 ubiquitin- ligase PDZRN3 n=1 Tax=Paramuricea clavata TaxID=317549 RepID=A0A6S7FEM1_PARCT|nr:E3 ubiquitin- ligase PDZRN3 [Paramuricea clavata]